MTARTLSTVLVIALTALGSFATGGAGRHPVRDVEDANEPPAPEANIYASDSAHLWNRVFRMFYVRLAPDGDTYGGDVLDPLLWGDTRYLLQGRSHHDAVSILDEFLERHGERLIADEIERALMQRDLIAVGEWLARSRGGPDSARAALGQRISRIIRRLALTRRSIESLPDNYAQAVHSHALPATVDSLDPDRPFLPPELLDPFGPWVCLGEATGLPVARTHLESFAGRSAFDVFLNVPGGRQATLAYLEQLRTVPTGWRPNSQRFTGAEVDSAALRSVRIPYPDPPEIPSGTRVALVRRIVLLAADGRPVATHLVESVQLRVYGAVPDHHRGITVVGQTPYQHVFELELSRRALFARLAGGLRAVGRAEHGHQPFMSHDIDVFELRHDTTISDADLRAGFQGGVTLASCGSCHEAFGLPSMISYSRERFGPYDGPPPKLIASTPDREAIHHFRYLDARGTRRIWKSGRSLR